MDTVTTGLLKGCLAGLGLVVVFFAISGLTYLVLNLIGLPHRMVLFLSIGSGPIVGMAECGTAADSRGFGLMRRSSALRNNDSFQTLKMVGGTGLEPVTPAM